MDTPDPTGAGAGPGRSKWWWLFIAFSALPLIVWWASWYPGMLSHDSVRQLAEVEAAEFTNDVPAIHSILVWLITRLWHSPAAVTLVQVVAMIALLAAYVRRSHGLLPGWLGGSTVLVFAWLPAVGATTIALEVQVAQTLVGLWILVELIGMARDPVSHLSRPWPAARLGTALGMAWLLDHAGIVVVILVVGALGLGMRRRTDLIAIPLGAAIAVFVLVQGPVYAAFSVDRGVTPLGEAYAPEIAAVHRYHPGWFDDADLDLMRRVADLEVWRDAYRCGDGASLVGDRDFDTPEIRADPGPYRGMLFRAAAAHPFTTIGHRTCAAGFLFLPAQPAGEQFGTYVYNIPPNALGIARDSRWEAGFNFTKAILVRVDQPERLGWFWRPGILVWPALVGIAILLARQRRVAWPAVALPAFLVMAYLTVREPSFRESFAVYSLAFLSLPLWWVGLRGPTDAGAGQVE